MDTYFNIRYEFDRETVWRRIDEQVKSKRVSYVCVADGVILDIANRDRTYLGVVNGGMFSICDSSYVPLYLRWIYGKKYEQYCGSQIFMDLVKSRKYRMLFMGASREVLEGLRERLAEINPDVEGMRFVDLPFKAIDDFDYKSIAETIDADGADIIWIALGAPKQEQFMSRLKPFLQKGVMIAVGAAFKFYSGVDEKRAPNWMLKAHLEFLYRILLDPKKQLKRCGWIVWTLPGLLYKEWKRKKYYELNCVKE